MVPATLSLSAQPGTLPALAHAKRVLSHVSLTAAEEFTRITRIVLAEHTPSHGLLNRNGDPLEFAVNPATNDLRFTMELAAQPAARLQGLSSILAALDAPYQGIAASFSTLQTGAALRWGAWLSARLPFHAQSPVRFKIYAETPSPSSPPTVALLDQYQVPHLATASLVMIAASPASPRCEFYFEPGSLTAQSLALLLAPFGLAHRLDDLTDALCRFSFRRGYHPDGLPKATYGFSYSVLPGGAQPVFSLFVHAAQLAGADLYLRRQFLAAHPHPNEAITFYADLTQSLPDLSERALFHNMLTVSISGEAPPTLQFSLCPPPAPKGLPECPSHNPSL
jgi:hypothetical protein